MTTTPSPEAIEAALDAVRSIDGPASIGSEEVVTASLSAAYPLMEAQAQAEALREAADILRLDWSRSNEEIIAAEGSDVSRANVSDWLRARATQAEFLAKAINDPEGRRLADAAKALATPGLGNWPKGNTHRAIIETSVPPGMEFIAAGPLKFCQDALADWTTKHPLGEFDTAIIVEVIR